MNQRSPFTALPNMGILWIILICAFWLLAAIIHISLAIGVLEDTERLHKNEHRRTFLVGGNIWALATLLGGIITAAIYWAIHHSNLRPAILSPPPRPCASAGVSRLVAALPRYVLCG